MLRKYGRRFRRMMRRPRLVAQPYPAIEAYSWQPEDGSRNFGDHLARVVTAGVAARRGLTLEDEVSRSRRLLTIGSVLHLAREGDAVWGSGINGKIALERLPAGRLDVRAVRGPKTAALLRARGHHVPDVFGDPALLVPVLFPGRFTVSAARDYVVVPNLHDLRLLPPGERIVSPLQGWNRCVEQIVQARFVVASSLHGVIIAEAFGIPARLLRLSETENPFKYDDYAQGTGRERLDAATSIEQALAMGGHPPIRFDAQALLDAFPYDIWA